MVTEGDTLDEVVANLREAIALHLEDQDLAEWGFVDDHAVVAMMELDAMA